MNQEKPADTAISVVGLTKKFGNVKAVNGLEFEVKKGEIFGFLGPNGAGKTTTIRILMNFIQPTGGIATILGMDSQDQTKQIHRQTGYLSGETEYYGNLTGRQYIMYMGNLQGNLDIKNVNKIARRLNAQLHIKIKKLSRGNKQKIGLITALQHKPDLLILDEPTSGLDPILQLEFRNIISEHKKAGGSAFISSHFLTEVEQICDTVGFINKGQVMEVRPLDKLHESSIHEFDVVLGVPVQKSMLNGVRGVREVEIRDNFLHCHISGPVDSFIKAMAHYPVKSFNTRELDLEEVFMNLYKKRKK